MWTEGKRKEISEIKRIFHLSNVEWRQQQQRHCLICIRQVPTTDAHADANECQHSSTLLRKCISYLLLNGERYNAWALMHGLRVLLSQLLNLLGLNSNLNVVTASQRRMFSAIRRANLKVKATSKRLRQAETIIIKITLNS